jgi:hypothetical protein
MPPGKSLRYEAAHRALLDRSRNLPPETSPEDLRIRTLEHATAFLHAQIQEAQEYTEQLRRCLADRDTKLREHQGYQREKWRTDRRLTALRVLMESSRVPYQMVPKIPEDEMASLPARKQANLTSFFQRGSRKAPLRFNCAVTGKGLERRILKQVSPLLLKPPLPPTRSSSFWAPDIHPPLYARRKQSEKMIDTASTREGPWASPSSSYSVDEGTTTSALSPKTIPDDILGATHNGIARILSPILRSEEEIIAEMGEITLPAYAWDLLEDLDYVLDKVPLQSSSSRFDGSPSPLLVTPLDWEYPPREPSIVSPLRTATVRIPDRRLADALLSSPESETTPQKRERTHKVSLDPAFFKDDSRSDKLGEAAPIRHSIHVAIEEEERKPRGLLKRKSFVTFSRVSRSSDRRVESVPSTPRKNIVSMVKMRMPSISRFR